MSEQLNRLEDLLKRCKAAGAEAADAILLNSVSMSHQQRLGKIERLEREESQDLGLRVLIGKRQAIVSTSDLSTRAMEEMVERAIAMAKSVPEDPYCGLADPEQLARDIPDIDGYDALEPSAEELIARASACEEAARAVAGVTNSDGAEAAWGLTEVALAATNGFTAQYKRTSHSIGVSVLAGTGADMQRDYDYTAAVHGEDLEAAGEVGKRAGERTVARLHPQPMKTGKIPVILDPRVGRGLLGHLAGAISGTAIARGTSFLKDSLGEQIFDGAITVIEDPHRKRGFKSRPFDGEGLPTQRRKIIDQGILTTWVLDLSTARKLGLEPTGHASRGLSGPPSPGLSNLYLEPGDVSAEEMLAAVDEGLFITDMMGMGVNGVTGDYSRGAGGFRIEKGELTVPVSEVTVAGNLKSMFKQITAANDLVFKYGTDVPTLRVEGMTVAGSQ